MGAETRSGPTLGEQLARLERRLAATDARLTALVEVMDAYWNHDIPTDDYRARLAALRAPGDATPSRAQSQVDELGAFILAEVDGEPSRSEGAVECAIRVIREHIAALATARRERDEAVGVVRDWHRWRTGDEGISFGSVVARARALVAGEAGPDPRDALRARLDEAGRLIERCIAAIDPLCSPDCQCPRRASLLADLRAWGKP